MSGGKSGPDPYYQRDPPKSNLKQSTQPKKQGRFSEEAKEKMRIRALERWKDPAFRARMSEAFRKRTYSDEGRKRISERRKLQWKDPEYRRKTSRRLKRAMANPEQRRIRSEKSKKAWMDPKLRGAQSEHMMQLWKDNHYREKVTKGVRKAVKNPDWIEAHAEALRQRWRNPESHNRQGQIITKRWENAEYREKLTKSRLDMWSSAAFRRREMRRRSTQEYREKISKSLSKYRYLDMHGQIWLNRSVWRGQRSRIMKRDGYVCQACGKKQDRSEIMSGHHIIPRQFWFGEEYPDAFIVTLCRKCHGTTDRQHGFIKFPISFKE